MPADIPRTAPTAQRPAHDRRRRSERRPCNIGVIFRTPGGELTGNLLNLTTEGFGARIDTILPLKPGARLMLVHPQIGEVAFVIRWAIHPRYGAEFLAGQQARVRLLALYDTLPPGPGEVA